MDTRELMINLQKLIAGDKTLLELVARTHCQDYDQMSAVERILAQADACRWIRDCFEAAGWDLNTGLGDLPTEDLQEADPIIKE